VENKLNYLSGYVKNAGSDLPSTVRDELKLSKLRAEHPMLTLIELIYVKKHEKLTLACKGDTLPAILVWFHHNLADFSNSNNDFCCFLSVITRYYDGPYTLLESGQVFYTDIYIYLV
jgi:hypothetical protein